jgi:hypothetical protein
MKTRKHFLVVVAILGIIAGFTACDNSERTDGDTTLIYKIGDTGPDGGKIFYVSSEGFIMTDNSQLCHYLEAAPADMAETLAWASSSYDSTDIPDTETAIGTGRKNTALILATDANAPAAKACMEYSGGSKIDWFLPSKEELNELYNNKVSVGHMGANWYLSSSQYYDYTDSAWGQYFSKGKPGNYNKSSNSYVRAVRAF